MRSSQVLWVQSGPRTFFMTPGQVAGMRAVGAEVDLFAQQQLTSSPRVLISGRGGAPIEFGLNIEGKIDRKFKGRLEVTAIGSRLEPIIKVELESAVAAVVAAEMPVDSPVEALKAMAVLARSSYIAGGRRHGTYDFCDTTHCQWRRETISESHPAMAAVQATAGLVVTHRDRPFAPMYHASCGGQTKSALQVGLQSEPYPYFAVECEACRRSAVTWARRLPRDIGRPLLTGSSEALRLDITRQLGSSSLPGSTFKATEDGDVIIVEGKGEGHGVGVCQRGIVALAKAGQEFRSLLTTYLPQTRTGSFR